MLPSAETEILPMHGISESDGFADELIRFGIVGEGVKTLAKKKEEERVGDFIPRGNSLPQMFFS